MESMKRLEKDTGVEVRCEQDGTVRSIELAISLGVISVSFAYSPWTEEMTAPRARLSRSLRTTVER